MNIPDDLKYTKTHEWVRVEGEKVVVGITEYAQKEIADVVFIELPQEGSTINVGESVCVVESVKAAFDVYSPLSGNIIEINKELENNAGIVNGDPYGKGWFFTLQLSNNEELNTLLDCKAYEKHIDET